MIAAMPFLLTGAGPSASAPPPPSLDLPIACTPGKNCFVQQYFDHDPGPGAKDYRCGSRVYDGHDGVDIRLPSVAAQRRGVAVLASADGVVTGARDGVEDRILVTDADRAAIRGRECGNGVLVTHANGWQTQYCHMARGSIAVAKGQEVKAGAKLGLVGLSGDTQFPHVHLTVRQGAREVDPFAPDATPGRCAATGGRTLWSRAAAAALAYRTTEVINIGFADGPVDMDGIEAQGMRVPTAASGAIVVYGRAIGLRAGDRMQVALTGPDGAVLAENGTPITANKAQYMLFGGKRRPVAGWPKGRYGARVTVTRGGSAVANASESISLP
ncbi:M23 family metallopeptidase [Sphingobium sufflavum]|uniref:M23 family metallopeptidase n=1 Tax=Sphingobium sufflavum TaxID=1129547 RepID=UPI001F251677|nr:M23 family metallopeptidase [Sphingobium sufflavum]MCE7795484.1 M23 family metallopeptidase [Sphingobium sufflavum]